MRILKNFLARFTFMLDKICSCDRIIQGFIEVGMVDAKNKFWPDFMQFKKREELSPYLKCQ